VRFAHRLAVALAPALAVAAVVFCVTPAAAADTATIQSVFARFCLAHHGDSDATLAAAETEGWRPVPTGGVTAAAAAMAAVDPKNLQGRMRGSDASLVLMTGAISFPIASDHKAPAKFCAVFAKGAAVTTVRTAAHAALGFAPTEADATGDIYAFLEKAGQRTPLPAADFGAALPSADRTGLSLAIAIGDGSGAALEYIVIGGKAR
jgi:hypothetical protein